MANKTISQQMKENLEYHPNKKSVMGELLRKQRERRGLLIIEEKLEQIMVELDFMNDVSDDLRCDLMNYVDNALGRIDDSRK